MYRMKVAVGVQPKHKLWPPLRDRMAVDARDRSKGQRMVTAKKNWHCFGDRVVCRRGQTLGPANRFFQLISAVRGSVPVQRVLR